MPADKAGGVNCAGGAGVAGVSTGGHFQVAVVEVQVADEGVAVESDGDRRVLADIAGGDYR